MFREGKTKENLESRQNLFKLQRRNSDNSFPIEPGVERDTLLEIEIWDALQSLASIFCF